MKNRRFLIVRTDRIGDVVLSTPVIEALRRGYPDSFIGMMVSPKTRELVEGNPYLNKTITFDKKKHKGVFGGLRFAAILRKKRFDTALVLHPTVRAHVLLWLSGIPERIGYDKKLGILLTKKIKHRKQLGEKHESEYSLDLLKHVGVKAEGLKPFVPVSAKDRAAVGAVLKKYAIDKKELVIVHPGASCPSKRWPTEAFAEVADEIAVKFNKKIAIIAGEDNAAFAARMKSGMRQKALDVAGKFSLGEVSALLENSCLLVSNDSGPAHMAAALGVPVVAIFGRKQPGLGHKRWGPVGDKNAILHKDAGCEVCLAHECKNGFKCLRAVSPAEVIEAAGRLLRAAHE
ncbi:MAG: lipopolysaccharide heptosyltransferase II [Candidatus Omnitrophota bacterium]